MDKIVKEYVLSLLKLQKTKLNCIKILSNLSMQEIKAISLKVGELGWIKK